MIRFIPLIVCLLGFCAYLVCSKAEPKELGRLAFFAGMFVVLLNLAASWPLR
jgi:hypothetical protein